MIFEVKLEWWFWLCRNKKWRKKRMVLEHQLAFSLVFFMCGIVILIFVILIGFFRFFMGPFFLNDFPNPIIVHSRSCFLLKDKFFWNCCSGLVLLWSLFCKHDFCYDHKTSQSPLQICFLFIRSCNFSWIACVTSFFTHSGGCILFIRMIKF